MKATCFGSHILLKIEILIIVKKWAQFLLIGFERQKVKPEEVDVYTF